MNRIQRIGKDGKMHTYLEFTEEEIAAQKAELEKRQSERNLRDE